MTESQWLACREPGKMLAGLRGKVSNRKLRLLAVACCRRLFGYVLTDRRTLAAVDVAECYAEGFATKEELTVARRAATAAREESWRGKRAAWWTTYGRPEAAARGAIYQPVPPPWRRHGLRAPRDRPVPPRSAALAAVAVLIRDIIGPPSHPGAIDPSWLTPAVASIARRAYDERDFAALPVLADALEEAGCTDSAILDHCREPGGHVRGCWVVDLLIGRA